MTAIDFGNPFRHVIQEVPVVCHGKHGAGVLGEVLLKPQHAFGIEVVGGLVEKKKVGLLEKQFAEGHPTTLATGEHLDASVTGRTTKGIHGLFQLGVEVPRVGRVNLFLEAAHFGQKCVVVGIGISQLRGDLVEARDLTHDLAHTLLHVLEHGLVVVQLGFLHQDAH